MRALVVYESMYGNTRTIAEAITEGLARRAVVQIAEVGAAPTVVEGIDLLVVGGPTHAFSMSRAGTRESAGEREPGRTLVSRGLGIREWLDRMRCFDEAVSAATFDTKVEKPRLPGSAGAAAEKRLRTAGFRIAAPHETFLVIGSTGPLVSGEAERATAWGEALAVEVAPASA